MDNKECIVIGSVLKPVNDPRMYEKLGISFVRTGKYNVHIAGFCANKHETNTNIHMHTVFCSERLSIRRLLVPLKFYKILLKVKPKVIIVETHEYLLVTSLYKILFGGKFIYDVRENYRYNILYTNAFPKFVRPLLAMFVRTHEQFCSQWIDQFWLAEQSYASELSFIKDRYLILENKFQPLLDVSVIPRRNKFNLFYSGTIAEGYGVYEAVDVAKKLYGLNKRYNLTIIGYAARPEDRQKLRQLANENPFINLVGIDRPVPHSEILKFYKKAGVGLLLYRDNKSTRNCIPTKFFEYLYHQIPFLITPNPFWENYLYPFGGYFSFTPTLFDPFLLNERLDHIHNYKLFSKKDIIWTYKYY